MKAQPFLFNPYTGLPRDPRDIESDPEGLLIANGVRETIPAQKPVGYVLYSPNGNFVRWASDAPPQEGTVLFSGSAPKPVVKWAILGAIGRGWCHEKNSCKVVDADLSFAIAEEVWSLLQGATNEAGTSTGRFTKASKANVPKEDKKTPSLAACRMAIASAIYALSAHKTEGPDGRPLGDMDAEFRDQFNAAAIRGLHLVAEHPAMHVQPIAPEDDTLRLDKLEALLPSGKVHLCTDMSAFFIEYDGACHVSVHQSPSLREMLDGLYLLIDRTQADAESSALKIVPGCKLGACLEHCGDAGCKAD